MPTFHPPGNPPSPPPHAFILSSCNVVVFFFIHAAPSDENLSVMGDGDDDGGWRVVTEWSRPDDFKMDYR